MRNRKTIILIMILSLGLVFFLTAIPVFSKAVADFPLLEKFMKADFQSKKKAIEYIRSNYPTLRQDVMVYMSKNNPDAPAKMRAAKMAFIAKKYPGLPVKLPRAVMNDLKAKYPHPVLDIAVDVSKIIKDKYPTLPADVIRWRNESKIKSKTRRMLRKKHPALFTDVISVLTSKDYPKQFAAMKADMKEMMAKKHPGLKMKVKAEVVQLVLTKYPELPEKIAAIRENPLKNPRMAIPEMICKEYPGLLHEILTVLRDKHGDEINAAVIDALELAERKYPELISNFQADMSEMIAAKHPTLLTDIGMIRVKCRKMVGSKLKKKYPAFKDDMKKMMADKYPDLGKDITASIDKHYPKLREEMADLMKTRFGGVMADLRSHISKKHPKLIPEVSKILN